MRRTLRRVAWAAAGLVPALAAWRLAGRPVQYGTLVRADAEPDTAPSAAYTAERVTLTTSAGRRLTCTLRVPAPRAPGQRFPTLLLAGGRRTGRRAALYVDSAQARVILSCDYPWRDPARLSWPSFILRFWSVRAEMLATSQAFAVEASYLAGRPEADLSRFAAIGASLGVPPMAVWAGGDPRPKAVALLYGGGPLGRVFEASLADEIRRPWLRRLVAGVFGRALAPLEPTRTVARIAPRPLLVVGAPDDQWIPRRAVETLYAAAGEPKRLLWFGGPHMRTRDAALLKALSDSLAVWLDSVLR